LTVEAIERATLAAVTPPRVLEIDGWLVALGAGAISRARSAVPLRHDIGPEALETICAAYADASLPPAFRLADLEALDPVRRELTRMGFSPGPQTLVQTAPAAAVAAFRTCADVTVTEAPDEAWASVFVGEGFDPADGADRVAALSRAPDTRFVSRRHDGVAVAVGACSAGHGWAGVHGMRTASLARGRGYAGEVLAALPSAALERGVERVFLQVEAGNAPAVSLYAKAGFTTAWRYSYWAPKP